MKGSKNSIFNQYAIYLLKIKEELTVSGELNDFNKEIKEQILTDLKNNDEMIVYNEFKDGSIDSLKKELLKQRKYHISTLRLRNII